MNRTSYDLSDWQHYQTRQEVDALHWLAGFIPPDGIVVAVGAGAGTHTLAILETTEECVIFSIDIACGEDPINTNEHIRLQEVQSSTGELFSDSGHVIRIWGDSKVVGKRWPLPIDFLFIDGDHSEKGLRGDIREWVRHVKPGGVFAFHDYQRAEWPDVKIVVDELIVGAHECIIHKDTLIGFKKEE